MDKEVLVIYTVGYYSAIIGNISESVLVRWMNLEPVTQSEEENKYHILMHIYGIQKNGTDEPICRAGIET